MRKIVLTICALVPLICLSASGDPQDQPRQQRKIPEFEKHITTNLVLTDVIVTDSAGNYVHGLGVDDFRVFENGEEIEILAVDEYSSVETKGSPGEEPFARLYDSPPRNIVIILDRFFSSSYAIKRGKEAIIDFLLNRLVPGDRVMLMTYEKKFRVLQDLTTDQQRVKMAALGIPVQSLSPDTPEMQANITSNADAQMRFSSMDRDTRAIESELIDISYNIRLQNNVREFLEKMQLLAKSLKALPGRKTVILLSEGYDNRVVDYSTQAAGALPSMSSIWPRSAASAAELISSTTRA